MSRHSALLLICVFLSASSLQAQVTEQFYEIRSYKLGDNSDTEAIDGYLRDALIPALQGEGVGPIGVFTNSSADETGNERIFVVVPYNSADAVTGINRRLQNNPKYKASAEPYLSRGPREAPYQRIESELLTSMKCMPKLTVPDGALENAQRVYELRIYESANERLGNLKVDMFNNGEVPIFLDCGIQPIFIGQAVVGPYTPNLTYLTMYPSEDARQEAWKAFRVHPDWKVLSKVPKYKGTVSKIHKYVLVPKAYSQM